MPHDLRVAFLVPLLLCAAATAQSDLGSRLAPVSSSVRNGGTFHVATGTWTRAPGASATLGPDVLYDNTCPTGLFANQGAEEVWTDEGRVPSPSSPDTVESRHGCAPSYLVEGFQIAFCTNESSVTLGIDFRSAYVPCSAPAGAPTASFLLSGLPHATAGGPILCWTIVVDLTAPAGVPGRTFVLDADADGTFGDGLDTFGWSFRAPSSSSGTTGLMVAGRPALCPRAAGTAFDDVPNMAEAGTGLGAQDLFYLENSFGFPDGCFYFGPSAFGGFHLELYGTTCADSGPAQQGYCFGTACPCGNDGAAGRGCANAVVPTGASLVGTGSASLSNDSVVLAAAGMPASASGLYFQGSVQNAAGFGTPFGDGKRCASGHMLRLGIRASTAGASSYPSVLDAPVSVRGQVTTPGTRTYQVWYRDNSGFCSPARFNLTNGWQIYWSP